MAPGLEKPWYVKNHVMTKPKGGIQVQMDIYLDFERGSKLHGEKTHGTVEQSWQHPNFFQHKCHHHAYVPKIQPGDGKTETKKVPLAGTESGLTSLFIVFSMLLIESEMTVTKAANIVDVYAQRLWNIYSYWIKKVKQDKYNFLSLLQSIANTYIFKVLFKDFWGFKEKKQGSAFLFYWCDLVNKSKIYP